MKEFGRTGFLTAGRALHNARQTITATNITILQRKPMHQDGKRDFAWYWNTEGTIPEHLLESADIIRLVKEFTMPAFQPKRKPYRNKKILDAARGEQCLVQLPGCPGGGADTVAAHSNRYEDGKGGSQKADDCFVAFACQHCHDILDGKNKRILDAEELTDYDVHWYHDRGIKRTIRRLLDLGVIK